MYHRIVYFEELGCLCGVWSSMFGIHGFSMGTSCNQSPRIVWYEWIELRNEKCWVKKGYIEGEYSRDSLRARMQRTPPSAWPFSVLLYNHLWSWSCFNCLRRVFASCFGQPMAAPVVFVLLHYITPITGNMYVHTFMMF